MADTTNTPDTKFYLLGRELAHTDKAVRDKAVDKIRREITSLKEANELEMMKLWKGLFYTFWMSDKRPVQEELAENLSRMIFEFTSHELSYLYLECFWKTMAREWNGIDRLRMDKYLLLMRKFICQTFIFLKNMKWDETYVQKYTDLVLSIIYGADYSGMISQYCECFLDELFRAVPHIHSYYFMKFMHAFKEILMKTLNSVIVDGVKDRVFTYLINGFETYRTKGEPEEKPCFDNLDLRYVHDMLFDVAFGKQYEITAGKRKNFNDLELAYETAVKERYDSMDAPALTAPAVESEEEAVKPVKAEKKAKKTVAKKAKQAKAPVEKKEKAVAKTTKNASKTKKNTK